MLPNTDLGLETERHHIASFDVGGDESLASKKRLGESDLFGEGKIEADRILTRPETWGAFHLSELAGRTITGPVIVTMKSAISKCFC